MDDSVVSSALEAFDLGQLRARPRRAARGAMGEVWEVHTDRGAWAVKLLFDPTAVIHPDHLGFQAKARRAGVTLPDVRLTTDGSIVARTSGGLVRCYAWIGLGQELPAPVSDKRASEAGRLLGVLHGLSIYTDAAVDPWYLTPPSIEAWETLVDRAASIGSPWADLINQSLPLLSRLTEFAGDGQRSGRPILCHRDFNRSNVMPACEDGDLVVLDWDNCGPLDPESELGSALLAFCAEDRLVGRSAVDAFLSAYSDAGGVAELRGAESFRTAVTTRLNFPYAIVQKALEDPAQLEDAEAVVFRIFPGRLDHVEQVTKELTSLTQEIQRSTRD